MPKRSAEAAAPARRSPSNAEAGVTRTKDPVQVLVTSHSRLPVPLQRDADFAGLNPVERIWEYLKERYLSHRLHDDYDAIEAAITVAWNKLLAETGRLTSLTWLPWEPKELANATSQKL